MKLFGWKSAGRGLLRPVQNRARGGDGVHVHLSRSAYGAPLGAWPQSYEAQLREGYLHNAIAQRSVRMVAEGLAAAAIKSRDSTDGQNGDAVRVLVKATSGGQSLLETVAAHILLHGNAYIEIIYGADGMPTELYALRPERMTVETDGRGWPIGFIYRVGGLETQLPTERVIHIRNMHPLDDHYGLGCLGAASGPVSVHNAASKWNKALLDNAARPSGALTYDTGDNGALTPEQFDRLRTELDASFAGAMNAGRPMLLEGGLKWQALSMSPADMDFVALKAGAARDIALAFGVPPMLLGLPGDATYANYREANKALWRQSILPLATKILDAITQGLQPWFAGVALSIDEDNIPALSEERERLWTQLEAADFLTQDEKRELAGFAALHKQENNIKPADTIASADNINPMPQENPIENKMGILELKFNPWHDTQDGKFTGVGEGQHFGGGGASGSWKEQKPKSKRSNGGSFRGIGASGSWSNNKIKTGGGGFGGGGASGSWSDNQPKPKSVTPQHPKHSKIIKATTAAVAKPAPIITHRITDNGYHFDIDTSSRTRKASGELKLQPNQGRSKRKQKTAGGSDRLPDDHGGHYIARQFGGSKASYNHFAQNSEFNNGEYRNLEMHWRALKKQKHKIVVEIKPHYQGESQRPFALTVVYSVDGFSQQRYFANSKKGD